MDHISPLLVAALFCLIVFVVTGYPAWSMRRLGRYSPLVENRLRLPGESLRALFADSLAELLQMYIAMLFAMLAVIFLLSIFDYTGVGALVVACSGALVIGYIACRINKTFRRTINVKIGLNGEEYTGQELNLLATKGAYVFHDIPYKYGNIDHVVVGFDKIFVVETKSVRKPRGDLGEKEAKVSYDGARLHFPHFTTDAPLKQAACHADYLSNILKKDIDCTIPVVPVVALPGWYVDSSGSPQKGVQVINPKRGSYIRKQIGERRQCDKFTAAVKGVERLARLDSTLASITDPDAAEHFNLWTNEPRSKSR